MTSVIYPYCTIGVLFAWVAERELEYAVEHLVAANPGRPFRWYLEAALDSADDPIGARTEASMDADA